MSDSLDIRKMRSAGLVKNKTLAGDSVLQASVSNQTSFWKREIRLGGSGLKDNIKEDFYLELASMLQAGVDIRTALEIVSKGQKKVKYFRIFEEVMNLVTSGMALSESLNRSNQFSVYESRTVQIGEETGKLSAVLAQLADYFKNRIKQRRQIAGALTYPLIVMIVAFGAVFFMVNYVVPMFSDTFKRFGNDLPGITKFIVNLSVAFKTYAVYFILVIVFVVVFILSQRKKDWFKKSYSRFVLSLPVVGEVVRKIYLSRFAGTMALLIGSKVPMVQAIELSRQMINFYPVAESLKKIAEDITNGISLHESMNKFTIYPHKMISIIKVAEEVNQLESFFARIGKQFADDAEYQTSLLGKFLEPFIIVVLGLIVGIILIAMYLPLFKLGQSF